ncbi:MAG TPA: 2-C-methyl-D-erythritol 2,4-cyclodiphosphate synthase [Acidimicrobiia bacterium]|nr:2-C-methyl-D-erythritol 2,4-cyclodiphosphate synthase [Acidimicrobiia bacterium]
MNSIQVGLGLDAHRFGGVPPIILGGVVVDKERGLLATSDGDVAAHALADALLGAAKLGDLGDHFPSSDPQWEGAASMVMLQDVVRMVEASGGQVASADLTIVAEDLRIAPHRSAIAAALSKVVGAEVSVKATSTDGLGFLGRGEGLAALAVAVITI